MIAQRGRARFRGAAAATASRRVAREDARRGDPGVDRVLRPARAGRRRSVRACRSVERRAALESMLAERDAAAASHAGDARSRRRRRLVQRFEGAGLDGVMAKPTTGTYEPNKRVMLKVKHERDCDCVVAGFRWHKGGEGRRSVRCCSACTTMRASSSTSACARASPTAKRRELVAFLAPYRENALDDHPWKAWAECAGASWAAAQAGRRESMESRARICRGSRCGRSSSCRWRTITCRARAFATRRSSVAGAPTSGRATARSSSSRSSPPQEIAEIFAHEVVATAIERSRYGRDLPRSRRLADPSRPCAASSRHSRVGSSSGSGVSCGGRCSSGTLRQVHANARPGGRPPAHRVHEHVVDAR